MKITLPEPSLVLLIGVAGCGKSTFARTYFAPPEIISSDHCRALVCDDENDQSVNQEAFEILHLIAAKRLAHRKLTVIDATNVQPRARAMLLSLADEQEVPAIGIVFNFDPAICIQRNAQRRHRIVGSAVIFQQHQDLQQSLGALAAEGFHAIYIFTSPSEIPAVTILREKLS